MDIYIYMYVSKLFLMGVINTHTNVILYAIFIEKIVNPKKKEKEIKYKTNKTITSGLREYKKQKKIKNKN